MNPPKISGPFRLFSFSALSVIFFIGVAFAAGPQQHLVYTFPGQPNAAGPTSALISDTAGNLYGTTADGGTSENCIWSGGANDGCGAVFELSPKSGGGWSENILYSFQNGSDGGLPYGGLVMDAAGNLYGAAAVGGSGFAEFPGTIYEVSPPAVSGGAWTFTKLYTFQSSSSTDGSNPYGTLIFDHAGNLYGTTSGGGASNDGTVFKLSPPSVSGGSWTESVLHSFSGSDGVGPMAGLYMDGVGNLYGTTVYGGNYTADFCQGSGCGVAFKLAPSSGGTWTEMVLHEFNLKQGRNPYSGLTFSQGNFYGTVPNYQGGDGSVFELSPGHGGPWTFTIVHNFGGPDDGTVPYAGVIADPRGNLYGTTSGGGSGTGGGTVYKLAPPAISGGAWTETVLTSFSFSSNNSDPVGGLLLKGSRLYGTNSGCQGQFFAGCSISGTVFAITGF